MTVRQKINWSESRRQPQKCKQNKQIICSLGAKNKCTIISVQNKCWDLNPNHQFNNNRWLVLSYIINKIWYKKHIQTHTVEPPGVLRRVDGLQRGGSGYGDDGVLRRSGGQNLLLRVLVLVDGDWLRPGRSVWHCIFGCKFYCKIACCFWACL